MSIASEISRLQGVKSDILQAISDKGVTVPAGSTLADCPSLIASISGGGGGGGDIPEDYDRLLSITNGTGYTSGINLNNYAFPLNVESNDRFIFSITIGTSFSASNPELDLIMNYPIRFIGFSLDNDYWYRTNAPIYVNSQGGQLYMSKGRSYVIEQWSGKIKVNGTEYTISTNTGNQNQSITQIMTIAGNTPQQIYIHGIDVIDENGNYKYNLVPVNNKNSGRKGLFDTVSQTFLDLNNYQN